MTSHHFSSVKIQSAMCRSICSSVIHKSLTQNSFRLSFCVGVNTSVCQGLVHLNVRSRAIRYIVERETVWPLRCITRENNRKYTRKKSQVCQTILVIAHFMRHHTCDRYLRFFRVYLRFAPYLRYLFDKHTCDLNRKYVSQNRKYGGPKGPNAHISQVCQGVADAKIASMSKTNRKYVKDKARINRKYAKDESQVCQGQITSMPRTNHKYVKDKSQVVKDKSQVCQQKISQVCYL